MFFLQYVNSVNTAEVQLFPFTLTAAKYLESGLPGTKVSTQDIDIFYQETLIASQKISFLCRVLYDF